MNETYKKNIQSEKTRACRITVQYMSPLLDKKAPPLPQRTHGIDDHCMYMTSLPAHLICTGLLSEENSV